MTAERRQFSTDSSFERDYAYSRAVVQEPFCFVAGTTGYDFATMSISSDVAAQARQALHTIRETLATAGFSMHDVVRTVIYLADPADHPKIRAPLQETFGSVLPVNTTVGANLMTPEMKIEIEVTAMRRTSA